VYLTKLTLNPRSRTFRRDAGDVHDMHRTVMSAYPELPATDTFRQTHGVLWRVDAIHGGFLQYVQSHTNPEWERLPEGHLLKPAEVRPLQPVLDSIKPGRKFMFRLVANPTRCVRPEHNPNHRRRVPIRDEDKQVQWLIGKGDQHGFVIPASRQGSPNVAATPIPTLVGKKRHARKITIEPVRFDGHLVVTEPEAFTDAVVNGIGRAKSYGCGLLSLAAPRAA
jgi:CRISPR system Cascade subunit CasE